MVKLPDIDNCCGCGACIKICPKNAVEVQNIKGFSFPEIDKNKCVDCKLCENTCPAIKKKDNMSFKQEFVAFSNKNKEEKSMSTSGGAFYKLAQLFLEKNGCVFGAVLDDNLKTIHVCAEDIETVKKMRGSKYVQSDISNCFDEVIDKLSLNNPVLFSGTPCQCDAIKNFVMEKRVSSENLFLCDLICHGVVSPKVFFDYIDFCERKAGKKIIYHKFRSKINGWHTHTEENVFEDGTKDDTSVESQLYKKIFYSHLALRKACFNCNYANLNRISDITIGDYWGVEKHYPELDDNTGLSLVIINSGKGKAVFSELENVSTTHITEEEAMQPQLKRPVQKPEIYDCFWRKYERFGFEGVLARFFNYGISGQFYRAVRIFKRIVRKLFKMVLRTK